MTATDRSLRDRFRDDLRSGSLVVSLTAVPLAMVVGLGTGWYAGDTAFGFALLLSIGVFVPSVHESYWVRDDAARDASRVRDVAWTVAASVAVTGLFAASHLLATTALGDSIHAVPIAFVATVLCGDALGRLHRRRRGQAAPSSAL